jgi:hypothetical protein
VYNNNPCTEDDLKESIQDVMPSISPAELQCIIKTSLFHVTSICELTETIPAPSLNMQSESAIIS